MQAPRHLDYGMQIRNPCSEFTLLLYMSNFKSLSANYGGRIKTVCHFCNVQWGRHEKRRACISTISPWRSSSFKAGILPSDYSVPTLGPYHISVHQCQCRVRTSLWLMGTRGQNERDEAGQGFYCWSKSQLSTEQLPRSHQGKPCPVPGEDLWQTRSWGSPRNASFRDVS